MGGGNGQLPDPLENLGVAGWFADENRLELDHLIREHPIQSVVEIGSFLGLSAIWFARYPQIKSVTCVDLWFESANYDSQNNLFGTLNRWELPRDFFHLFRTNVMRSGYWHKIHPVRGNSHYVSGEVPFADLVYVDGDHSQEGCSKDILTYREKARSIICGDDYSDREGFGVIQAVSELLPNHRHHGPFWWSIL